VRWVEVVEAEAAAVVVLAVEAEAGRAGWVALRPPVQAETVFAPTAGIVSRTPLDSHVTRRSAPSAARRWLAYRAQMNGAQHLAYAGHLVACNKRGPGNTRRIAVAAAVDGRVE